MTAAFDDATDAGPFDYSTAAELYSTKGRKFRRQPLGYRRFDCAADAIRFAVEEMSSDLNSVWLEVDEKRFDSRAIRSLYDSAAYPLVRAAATDAATADAQP
jgi:hypothetical protein